MAAESRYVRANQCWLFNRRENESWHRRENRNELLTIRRLWKKSEEVLKRLGRVHCWVSDNFCRLLMLLSATYTCWRLISILYPIFRNLVVSSGGACCSNLTMASTRYVCSMPSLPHGSGNAPCTTWLWPSPSSWLMRVQMRHCASGRYLK